MAIGELLLAKNVIDKEIGWIDQSVAGGDRLREEWREACKHENKGDASEPLGQV